MAQNMKLKYDKYWGSLDSVNQFLLIAVVLDPSIGSSLVTDSSSSSSFGGDRKKAMKEKWKKRQEDKEWKMG
ncbi:hypothetical protein GBA52_014856 [Prunus armeniaca]|nr:hypothetical protein GBA52_014856 [Prunus armeniaca]